MSMYLGIVPALTVLAMSISPEAPRLESLPRLDKLSALTNMVSVSLPRQADRVTYDHGAGLVKIPRDVLSLPMLERLIASPQVGFVVWSEQDAIYIGLSSVHTRAYMWRGNRLIIGSPRSHEALNSPRISWLGPVACIEEVPSFEVTALHKLWVESCGGTLKESEEDVPPYERDLDLVMLGLRDNELRGWGELLKHARGDADSLDPAFMTRFEELSTLYRRHATLHLAMSHANDDALIEALDVLDRARIMGRRYDVKSGAATDQRIHRLGNGWTMRVLVGLFQRGEESEALAFYDLYRHWTDEHPSWLKRRVAQAMRREDRAREALQLYHEVLPQVSPEYAILGEIGTAYIENNDPFRARSVQLWLEQAKGLALHSDFTVLLQRVESDGVCPPDTSWTTRCIEARKAEHGEYLDVLIDESVRVTWGKIVPTVGRVHLKGVDASDEDEQKR